MAELTSLLEKLVISGKAVAADDDFAEELAETEFRIFKPISDLGYFSWEIEDDPGYKEISTLQSKEDIIRYINFDGKPDNLKPVNKIRLPHRFKSMEQALEHDNKFPYGQIDIGCLYVAAKHRGVDMTKIHFAFGGSTLEMLASKDDSSSYITTRIPGTDCILVVKRKIYTQNLSDPGFQFERLMTGKDVPDAGTAGFVEHMQIMKVGDYNVLFRAESDAILHGSPVEIKASNPRYWGTKVMFQMISSGSTKLCHGEKSRGTVTRITLQSLSTVVKESLEYSSISLLQENILEGMQAIESQLTHEELRKISFSGGSLKLIPTSDRASAILPPPEIVISLLE